MILTCRPGAEHRRNPWLPHFLSLSPGGPSVFISFSWISFFCKSTNTFLSRLLYHFFLFYSFRFSSIVSGTALRAISSLLRLMCVHCLQCQHWPFQPLPLEGTSQGSCPPAPVGPREWGSWHNDCQTQVSTSQFTWVTWLLVESKIPVVSCASQQSLWILPTV